MAILRNGNCQLRVLGVQPLPSCCLRCLPTAFLLPALPARCLPAACAAFPLPSRCLRCLSAACPGAGQ